MAQRGRPKKVQTVKTVSDVVEQIVAEPVQAEPTPTPTPTPEPTPAPTPAPTPEPITKEDIYDLGASKGKDYSPFSENVADKSYRSVKTAQNVAPIDEPTFAAPTYDEIVSANEEEASDGSRKEPSPLDDFSQDEIHELPTKEKEEAADGLVEITLNFYGMGCGMLGKIAKISDSKVEKLQQEGLIDVNMVVPIDDTTKAPVSHIIESINSQVDESFGVSDDFKESVRPVMKRIFVKKGWGMTDEQTLIALFAQDIAGKVGVAMQMRSSAKFQLEAFVQMKQVEDQSVSLRQAPPEYIVRAAQEEASPTPQPITEEVVGVKVREGAPIEPNKDAVEAENSDSTNIMVETQNTDIKVNLKDLNELDTDV